MKKYIIISATAVLLIPFLTLAAQSMNNISDVGNFIINIINGIFVPVLIAVAFIVFIYGIATAFIFNAGDEEKRKEGKNIMGYGLIGFFIMLSVWGLIFILTNSVGLNNSGPSTLPTSGVQVNTY